MVTKCDGAGGALMIAFSIARSGANGGISDGKANRGKVLVDAAASNQ